jgi:hypothetical protein
MVHPWLASEDIDFGWILYEELKPEVYEAFRQDSEALRCPIALQCSNRPIYPLYLGVCLDGLLMERLREAVIGIRGPP